MVAAPAAAGRPSAAPTGWPPPSAWAGASAARRGPRWDGRAGASGDPGPRAACGAGARLRAGHVGLAVPWARQRQAGKRAGGSRRRRVRRRRCAQGCSAHGRRWQRVRGGAGRRWMRRRRHGEHGDGRGGGAVAGSPGGAAASATGLASTGRRYGGGRAKRGGGGLRAKVVGMRSGQAGAAGTAAARGRCSLRPTGAGWRGRRRHRPVGGFDAGRRSRLPRRGLGTSRRKEPATSGWGGAGLSASAPSFTVRSPQRKIAICCLYRRAKRRHGRDMSPFGKLASDRYGGKPGVQPTTWRRSATCRGPFAPAA